MRARGRGQPLFRALNRTAADGRGVFGGLYLDIELAVKTRNELLELDHSWNSRNLTNSVLTRPQYSENVHTASQTVPFRPLTR